MSQRVLIMRYMTNGYEICDVNYDQSGVTMSQRVLWDMWLVVMIYVMLVMSQRVLVMRYVGNGYEICDCCLWDMWFWLWAKWCGYESKECLVMRYVIISYKICDIGYDQSDVVISKRVLIMRYVMLVMSQRGIGYKMWLWAIWVVVMRYVINSYEICDSGYDQSVVIMS